MASLSPPLTIRRNEPDEQQLLRLFRNRAELKKDLAGLRRDREKLVNRLRDQERASQQVRDRLTQIENLLADPLQAANVMVYYQLRNVWAKTRERLSQLLQELAERQSAREREQHALAAGRELAADLALIDERIDALEARGRDARKDLEALDVEQRRLAGFWNYFRRRPLAERAEAVRALIEGLDAQIGRLQAERQEMAGRMAPAFRDLSITGKRQINLAIIAMAQQLFVQLSAHDVAARAREAAMRSMTDVTYGDVARCQQLMQSIQKVARAVEEHPGLNILMRRRAEYLALKAQYRRDIDTIPVAGSLAGVAVEIEPLGEPRPVGRRMLAVDVLAEDYWDINAILLG